MPIAPFEMGFTVRGHHCGYGGPLRPIALADMLQEAASLHAEALDLGKGAMGASGRTWMMARTDTRVFRSPREGETVTVRTWPSATQRLFALRDFEVAGEDGGILAAASYAYLIVDFSTRKPLRPEGILPQDLCCDRLRALVDPRYSAERPDEAWNESFSETARPRHIDHNGHVNNAHLIAWLCDAPPPDGRNSGVLAESRVEFAQEVLLGDVVTACWAALPARNGSIRHAAELRRGGDVCARADLEWR